MPPAARPARSVTLACDSAPPEVSAPVVYPQGRGRGKYLVFHAELTLALRRATELARISKHVIQRDFRDGCKLVLADLTIDNRPTTRIQSANHRTFCSITIHQPKYSAREGEGETHSETRQARRLPPS